MSARLIASGHRDRVQIKLIGQLDEFALALFVPPHHAG